MARLNDNNVGAISGAVRDMVNEGTNRAMNGHGFPEAPVYTEKDRPGSRTGSKKYILAGVLVLAALVLWFAYVFRDRDHRICPKRWKEGETISDEKSEQILSVVNRLGNTIWLNEGEPGIWHIAEPETGSRKIGYDNAYTYYRSLSDGLWFWYDTEQTPSRWQCWYEPISGDFGDFGWMEFRSGEWWIRDKEGAWIQVPGKYDTSSLWYIDSGPKDAK